MRSARRDPALSATIVESWALAGVRAGSALVAAGERLLLVQDDALAIVWIAPGARPGIHIQVIEGHGGPLAKADKPDFEAALLMPDGAVMVLGSGSTANRRRIARIDVPPGPPRSPPRPHARIAPADALYDALEAALADTPNIEGAVLRGGDVVRLFHRGSGVAASAIIDVPAGALQGGGERILSLTHWHLGTLDGPRGPVRLSFTDAASCPNDPDDPDDDDRIYWLAAAEDTPNPVDDGVVVGAAVGVLRGEDARFAPLFEPGGTPSTRKAEGIAVAADGLSGYLVTDPDDPARSAELCRFVLAGPW